MFSPIKNLITYIQKNASGNSIFGSNSSTTEETTKMETENIKSEDINMEAESEAQNKKDVEGVVQDEKGKEVPIEKEKREEDKDEAQKENGKEEHQAKNGNEETSVEDGNEGPSTEDKTKTCKDNEEEMVEKEQEIPSSDLEKVDKTKNTMTTSTVSTENSRDIEAEENNDEDDEEEDDIEAQIGSSIMIKKPVKVASSKGTEILEVKKSSNTRNSVVVISHDYCRNQTLTPIDDELDDFRNDPTEILGRTSSPTSSNTHADEFCSVGSAEEAKERDDNLEEHFHTEEEEDDEEMKAQPENNLEEDEDETEPEMEEKDTVEVDDDDEDEPFLDLKNYRNKDLLIVLDDVDLNASTLSIETNNTADDPLAIACEEQEAFAADKKAALQELNLLNTSQTSQDEDTTTTIEDDLQWLKTDLEDPQPSCSNKVMLKDSHHPTETTTPEKEERNGEGSDSGLGSETSALHTTATSITDTSQLNTTGTVTTPIQTPVQLKTNGGEKIIETNLIQLIKSPTKNTDKPFRSNLKRRLEVDDDVVVVDGLGNLTSSSSSSSSSALSDHSTLNGSVQKKPKRSINFDTVQVYYFPRQQGFGCVPSAGGCTLGMGARHVSFKTLTLAEHAAELRRAHRMQLQEINPRGSSSDDSEESEEDYLSEGSGSDLDGETNGFLQPVSPKQRRALLKAAGIRKIDPSEKADCRNIRNSREVCGCSCRDFCDPETCACSQSGIKCQVDRDMFPCGCSRDACGNTIGRVEFNPARVRTHFIHTLMRLEMENRQQQNPYSSAVASPSTSNPLQQPTQTPSSYYQSHLQPQSNYSSGYASPAYNTASELNHQQTAASSYYHPQTPSTASSLYAQPSLELTHNSSSPAAATTTATSQYGIDSLDSSLFGGSATATPSYDELMPIASYHYANTQSQGAPYNSYHNTTIYHNATTTLNTPPNTFSSCAVPSIPPYGTATTTEATGGVYHSVNSLTTLETTTAPSCSVSTTTSLESEVEANFISLSTPLASSSRLSQINDLLQHNRNATTALVAVTEASGGISTSAVCSLTTSSSSLSSQQSGTQINGSNYNATSSSINTPPIEDAHKTCMAYEELAPPLNPAPIVGVIEHGKITDELAKPLPPMPQLTAGPSVDLASPAASSSSLSLNTELLQNQTSLTNNSMNDDKEEIVSAVETITKTIEVAAGN